MKYTPGPIIAREAAPLKSLTVAMAVMCYLACLSIGALMLIAQATAQWTGTLSSEVTVQVREMGKADIEAELAKAEVLLRATAGVTAVATMSREDAARLLEPWLGEASGLDDLPVPRIIGVTLDAARPPDLESLAADLKVAVPGASLDTHQQWQAELTRMASVLTRLAYGVLVLIALSAVAIVVFASRTVLDANRSIVEVLHLTGARDSFIARQIERRFLKTGLAAGLIGLGLGALTFLLIGLAGPWSGTGEVAAAARGLIFAPQGDSWKAYAALAVIPIAATLIGLVTSRVTLMRMLGTVM